MLYFTIGTLFNCDGSKEYSKSCRAEPKITLQPPYLESRRRNAGDARDASFFARNSYSTDVCKISGMMTWIQLSRAVRRQISTNRLISNWFLLISLFRVVITVFCALFHSVFIYFFLILLIDFWIDLCEIYVVTKWIDNSNKCSNRSNKCLNNSRRQPNNSNKGWPELRNMSPGSRSLGTWQVRISIFKCFFHSYYLPPSFVGWS